MIRAASLGNLADMSDAPGAWSSRCRHYDHDAREDFAMWAWLEIRGKLPPPGKLPRRSALREWEEWHSSNADKLSAVCPQCKRERPYDEFYWYGTGRTKQRQRSSACKSCNRKRQHRNWIRLLNDSAARERRNAARRAKYAAKRGTVKAE